MFSSCFGNKKIKDCLKPHSVTIQNRIKCLLTNYRENFKIKRKLYKIENNFANINQTPLYKSTSSGKY